MGLDHFPFLQKEKQQIIDNLMDFIKYCTRLVCIALIQCNDLTQLFRQSNQNRVKNDRESNWA